MLTEGMYIADRYEIIGKIGAGGMSDVYKAKDLTLGRFVAIKVLKPEFSEDLNFVTKFRTEAQSAAGLEHPNIVNIYDVGSEKGMHYIVMEYVEGITLKTYIEKKGQLSFKEAVSIAIQVGRGIEAAHSKGIIHRDIKPQNIIISTEGKVKVTDFGIARAASSNTISSDVMGSVHYSSPEQARNGFVDGKSDIYSLGIVMYEMVTGRVPFDGDTTVAVAIQHLQEEIVPPSAYAPNLPISMEKIILKCTQKNPDRRYESMTALLTDLRKALVSPNEDFVVMVPATNQDKTRIIGEDDLKQIKEEADSLYLKADQAVHARAEEMNRYDEDEDDAEDVDDDELDDEDDGDLNPKMEKAITIMGIVAAVVIVIIIIVIVVNLFGGIKSKKQSDTETSRTETTQTESQNADTVTVPDFRGMTYADAQTEAEKKGLKLENKGEVSSDDYDEGEIANQDPESGKEVEEGTTIGVVISNGKGSVEVPSVTGDSEDDAVSALEKEGFKPNKTYAYDDSVEEGKVISQTLLTDLRKALVSPNEDFVVMVPATNQDKTRIIGEDDLKQIKEEADSLYLKADQAVHARAEEMNRYDEDEDDAEDVDDDELDDEDDGDLNPKMEKAITIMGIVAAVVIVIIIIVIVVNLFGGIKSKKQSDTETSRTETTQTESQNADTVTVPDFRGMTYADAQTEAEKKGLKLENKGEVSSDDYDEGEIANQDPESGKEVEEGTTIGVVISNGKGSVEVPSVTGDSEDDAVSALEKEGFKPNKTYAYDDSVEEGKVISQTPSAGDKAKTGDTITIVISQGAEAVTVPDVKTTYKSEEQARDLLSDFNVTVKTAYSDSYPEGIVMDQSIDPGKQVEKGSDITITVSMGPSPSQSVTATTYSFKATINLPGDTSNVSGATITLYDTSGNVLGQWDKAITDDFSISKTGLLAKEGYLVISWLDLNGNKINDQTTSTYQFTPES